MKTNLFRICTVLAVAVAASQTIVHAQEGGTLKGVWDVSVTVTNCQNGALIRTVRSLQQFRQDGSVTETANTSSRGISEGVYSEAGDHTFNASYWFFRYNPDGTFASIAKVTDKITLGRDGEFTSAGTVLDFNAAGTLISTGCFVHSAKRLTLP
ncbi:MAG TPA: hypothetical protein VKR52_04810 [Terracidiphilus sp.]|nr:hypothetical protein [Terracidiphilus sp.]